MKKELLSALILLPMLSGIAVAGETFSFMCDGSSPTDPTRIQVGGTSSSERFWSGKWNVNALLGLSAPAPAPKEPAAGTDTDIPSVPAAAPASENTEVLATGVSPDDQVISFNTPSGASPRVLVQLTFPQEIKTLQDGSYTTQPDSRVYIYTNPTDAQPAQSYEKLQLACKWNSTGKAHDFFAGVGGAFGTALGEAKWGQ